MTKDNAKKTKAILQIKNGEYLLDVLHSGAINTTYKRDSAMDISGWSFEQVSHIISNLHKVGYTTAQVINVEVKE
jgi:hypothetical protein